MSESGGEGRGFCAAGFLAVPMAIVRAFAVALALRSIRAKEGSR